MEMEMTKNIKMYIEIEHKNENEISDVENENEIHWLGTTQQYTMIQSAITLCALVVTLRQLPLLERSAFLLSDSDHSRKPSASLAQACHHLVGLIFGPGARWIFFVLVQHRRSPAARCPFDHRHQIDRQIDRFGIQSVYALKMVMEMKNENGNDEEHQDVH